MRKKTIKMVGLKKTIRVVRRKDRRRWIEGLSERRKKTIRVVILKKTMVGLKKTIRVVILKKTIRMVGFEKMRLA